MNSHPGRRDYVKSKRTLLWLGVAALCALIVGATASAQRSATARVALVTDIGGLNDKGFNHLSYVGLQRAQKQLKTAGGVNGRVFITNSANDRKPNLQSGAQSTGNGLVIAVGVLFEFGPLDDVAPAFPNTKFAGIDVDWNGLSGKPKPSTVRGIQFREQEAGYLVGYIAGLWETRHPVKGKMVVGGVGANKVPAIVRFLAGYRAGVHKANKKIKVLIDYANDPTFVAKHILTSATKHVDVAVFNTIKQFKANPSGFKTGFNTNYTLKNNGVGYGKLSSALSKADRTYITKKVNTIKTLII